MVLKIGSKGPEVKILQEFLALKADGVFGTGTDEAVKKWQKKNGLTADGVVGPKTWEAMGLLTTDMRDLPPNSSPLNFEEYHLPPGQYFAGPTPKQWLFIHHTAGWENPKKIVDDWARDSRGAIATEFVIGGMNVKDGSSAVDGNIVHTFPTGGWGWHLGTGDNVLHRNSAGIECCNFGYLEKGGYTSYVNGKKKWNALDANSFYTYVGVKAKPDQVVTLDKNFRGFKYWHRYSDKLILSLRNTILFIANRDGINAKAGLPAMIKNKGAAAFDFYDPKFVEKTKGVWSHTNVRKDKFDMFPQQELMDMLVGL